MDARTKIHIERINQLGMITLEERYSRADMIQVYKILNEKDEIYPENFLLLNKRPGTNNSIKLYKGRSNLDI